MTDTAVYRGLPWTRSSQKSGDLKAPSRVTPATYVVRYDQPERVEAFCVFSPSAGRGGKSPHRRLGVFRDVELAVLACEWHDYEHAQSVAEGALVFAGSDMVAHLAEELAREAAADGDTHGLIGLLADDHVLPNGRPFRRMASYFEGRKTANKQEKDGSYTISLNVAAKDIPLWLAESPHGVHLTLGAVPLADADSEADAWNERCAQAFTRSHVLPHDPSFQEWLAARYDRWNLVASAMERDSEEVAKATLETLKRLIGIATRRDLHGDRDAVDRLERLDHEYYKDMARGAGIYVPAA